MLRETIINDLQLVFDIVFKDKVNVTEEVSAADVDDWDSISHVTLLVAVERKFGIRFRLGETEKTKKVGDLCKVIESHLSRKIVAA